MTTTSSLNSEKAALRATLRKQFIAPSPEASAAGWASLEALPAFVQAHTLLLYMSLPDEVPTSAFIARWHSEKRIALPVVDGESLLLREYRAEYMSPGWKGILEPTPEAPLVSPREIDLALVPGVAFDLAGGRLGRGRGFYDRLLPSLHCPLIGLCPASRLVPAVPMAPWDVKMDRVIVF